MREKSDRWQIDGQAIFSPTAGVEVSLESLAADNSGRNAAGIMQIKWLRRRIHKVTMKYDQMTQEEVAFMLNLIQGKEYNLKYHDPIEGMKTIRCYSSNSKAVLMNGVKLGGIWHDVSFSCIEI